MVDELARLDAADAVVLQSFDAAVLRRIRTLTDDDGPELVQLVTDSPVGDPLLSPVGMREVSTYAQAIGPSRERILRSAVGQEFPGEAPLVHEAHRADLAVFCWTLRAENAFLPEHLRRGKSPSALGNAIADATALLELGVDGLITDSPDHAVRAVKALLVAV